jgi:hypothetical protein
MKTVKPFIWLIQKSYVLHFFLGWAFFLFTNHSYSQTIGGGTLLEVHSLEREILRNQQNGKPNYDRIYSNFHFSIDLKQKKVDVPGLLKQLTTLEEVMDASFDESTAEIIILTQKRKDTAFESALKQHIDLQGALIFEVKELIYKN